MKQLPTWLVYTFLTVAVIGFLDATFLTAKYFTGGVLPCVVFHGCDTVTKSVYATIAGVPVALLGAFYYLSQIILVILFFDTDRARFVRVAALSTTLGFMASLYFIFLQVAVLHALCVYCILSAVSSTTLFVLGLMILRHLRRTL